MRVVRGGRGFAALGASAILCFVLCCCSPEQRVAEPGDDADTRASSSVDASDSESPGDPDTEADTTPDPFETLREALSVGENVCPEDAGLAPEPWRPASTEVVDATQPSVVWSKAILCPSSEWQGGDLSSKLIAYTEAEIEGRMREIVVAVYEGQGYIDRFTPAPYAVAVLDANTGETIRCAETPISDGLVHDSRLVVDGASGAFYLAITRDPNTLAPQKAVLWKGSVGGGAEALVQLENDARILDLTVGGAGDLLVNWDYGAASSHAPTDLAAHWVRDVSPPGPTYKVLGTGPETTYTLSRDSAEEFNLAKLDRCGEAEVRDGRASGRPLLAEGEFFVAAESTERFAGDVLSTYPPCFEMVTVSNDRFACLRLHNEDDILVAIQDFDGGNRVEVPREALPSDVSWQSLVAVEGGAVLLSGDRAATRFLAAVDADSGAVEWYFSYYPGQRFGLYDSSPSPLVTPRGLVIEQNGGWMTAVQSPHLGLARSLHPRGVLGGNENKGFVAIESN